MTRTIIIGAGVGGLATAALLARAGQEVLVLEKNDAVGGRIGVLERDGYRFDTGPSWYLMPEVMDHFFGLLGTSTAQELDLDELDPGYRVFSEPDEGLSVPLTIPLGSDRVAQVFESVEPGSSAALRDYLESARHTYEMARRFFLYNPFTRPASLLNREILGGLPTLVRLLSRTLESHIEARFRDPVLRQILGFHSVFIGTHPAAAPAMYHLMSSLDLDEGVLYPRGGFGRLIDRIEALATGAGARIVTGAEVTRILTHPRPGRGPKRRAAGIVWRGSDGEVHREDADAVVSNADLHHTETRLLSPSERSYPARWWRRRTSGPGAVIAMLGVAGELPQLLHHNLLFTRDWDANFGAIFGDDPHLPHPASMYVCRPTATEPGLAPAGHEALFLLIPGPAEPTLGSGGRDGGGDPAVEQAADRAIAQVAHWADIPDLAGRIVTRDTIGPQDYVTDFHSWRGGMLGPAHILSQSAMFRAQNASRKVAGLYYVGATTAPGIGVPMCLISAELVLKRMRGDHSPGPLPRLHPEHH